MISPAGNLKTCETNHTFILFIRLISLEYAMSSSDRETKRRSIAPSRIT